MAEQHDTRDSDRKQAARAAKRLVLLPKCVDKRRRKRLERDDVAWLLHYFGPKSGSESPFTYEFTAQQREMIAAIRAAIMANDDQAIAASRGEGKTTICERMILKYVLEGAIKFGVLFAATGGAAEDSLSSIKAELENNEHLMADYPEVCAPVRALEGIAQKANSQLVAGKRPDNGKAFAPFPARYSWCGPEIFFPNVPGSPSAGAIIATRGLDSAVRGLKKKGRRVDVAVVDDPDTEDTAISELQAKKLEKRIDRAIAGLGSQKRPVARVMITTLQSRTSVSYRYTDPSLKHSWKGRRFRFLVKPPEELGLWEQYVELQKHDWLHGTIAAREFYIGRRAAMDAGAIVANPNRFTANELSALQHYYNLVARIGPEAVATEYDNNPPEEAGPIESGITAFRVAKKLSGLARGVVPAGCRILSHGIDVGKRYLHWVVRAWRPDGSAVYTIDYGVKQTYGTETGSEAGLDDAIRLALIERMEELRATQYEDEKGEIHQVGMTLVDARYRTPIIYATCLEIGLGIRPVMGYGKSAGCVRANFQEVMARTKDRKPGGTGWFESRKQAGSRDVWLVNIDADHWKGWEHDRWLTPADKPGSMFLFGELGDDPKRLTGDELAHKRAHYPDHICAEVEVEESIDGVVKRYWKAKGENHGLDASVYCTVAAGMQGIPLHGSLGRTPKPKLRLSEILKKKREAE